MNLINTKNVSDDLMKNEASAFVINKLKEIVYKYEADAEVILFGSRACGGYEDFFQINITRILEYYNTALKNLLI